VDFNTLYHRHQVSLYLSEHAASERLRLSHRGLAQDYASMIAEELSTRRQVAGA
jgi:hypothetical protein